MNRNQLKLCMMSLMVLDHLAPLLPPQLITPFNILTRCVGVFFAFMSVEGFFYTRNRGKYLLRLYMWAGIMTVGNHLLNAFVFKSPEYFVYNNIFLTLALGVTALALLRKSSKVQSSIIKISSSLVVIAAACIIGTMFTEGGFVIIPFMILSYYFKDRPLLRDTSYLILSLLLLSSVLATLPAFTLEAVWAAIQMNSECLFITVIPFIHLYNGEKGSSHPSWKYLFYIFYPMHLWLISLAAMLLHQ